MNIDYAFEKERKKALANMMRENGWEVYEEVTSDQKNANGRYQFRLDIMAKPPQQDFFVGFELKLYDGVRQGGAFYEALKQTVNYQTLTFSEKKIDVWIIDLYRFEDKEKNWEWHEKTYNSTWIFMQSFLQKIGIGMIDRYGKITFINSNSEYIHRINDEYNYNTTDWQKILIHSKVNKITLKKEVNDGSAANS